MIHLSYISLHVINISVDMACPELQLKWIITFWMKAKFGYSIVQNFMKFEFWVHTSFIAPRFIAHMINVFIIEILWSLSLLKWSSQAQICTCHDSSAVVTYGKLWPDLIMIFHARAAQIFTSLDYDLISKLWNEFLILVKLSFQILSHPGIGNATHS